MQPIIIDSSSDDDDMPLFISMSKKRGPSPSRSPTPRPTKVLRQVQLPVAFRPIKASPRPPSVQVDIKPTKAQLRALAPIDTNLCSMFHSQSSAIGGSAVERVDESAKPSKMEQETEVASGRNDVEATGEQLDVTSSKALLSFSRDPPPAHIESNVMAMRANGLQAVRYWQQAQNLRSIARRVGGMWQKLQNDKGLTGDMEGRKRLENPE